ncbi:G protein-regulated inducer of neurite outgrowth 2 [Chanos chanos]|uniref:G protein-regulated inducer of neurite outgrowth 2 n=1 Tax=Chanos chanos TaxID=29144 RepID=A0A6J2VG55_CHACN|nr:G protein-regulated inducer of neurite outgrowth 2-like [Chanos chanos]
MADENPPSSEIHLADDHFGSTRAKMEDEPETPIIPMSKSSAELTSGPPQRMELSWLHRDLRKSASGVMRTPRPGSIGGPVPAVPISCDPEVSSVCSGSSTPETVIWRGGVTRPWSITEDSPCNAKRTPTQDSVLGHHRAPAGETCVIHSPSSHSVDLLDHREGHCKGTINPTSCRCSRTFGEAQSPLLTSRLCPGGAHSSLVQHPDGCTHHPIRGEIQRLSLGCGTSCINPPGTALRNPACAVPCPGHLLSRLPCTGTCCITSQRPLVSTELLGFPPLVSSVSETRLNHWGSGHCCGSQVGGLNAAPLQLSQNNLARPTRRTVQEASTMTSNRDLRDVGVQTGSFDCLASPELCEICESTGPEEPEVGRRSPVKEVEWDSEGMTWEVYGAAVDPEELGLAIQRHLELQIKEASAAAAQQASEVNVDGQSQQVSRRRGKGGGVMKSLRNPACCSSTTVD